MEYNLQLKDDIIYLRQITRLENQSIDPTYCNW